MSYIADVIVVGNNEDDKIVLSSYDEDNDEGEAGIELAIITMEGTTAFINLNDDDIGNLTEALEEARANL